MSEEKFRMPYETYSYLKSLIEFSINELEKDFHTACTFIPMDEYPTGIDKAHKIFSKEHAHLKKMAADLHRASQETYRDHPDAEMRKFWGLPVKEPECNHKWGTDGQHSNEYCKICFITRPKGQSNYGE